MMKVAVFCLIQLSVLVIASQTNSQLPKHDVAIIGGGPAGLATAFGIQRSLGKEKSIAIFERASSLREVGGQVGLQSAAFKALDALDPSGKLNQAVCDAGVQREKSYNMDMKGNKESELDYLKMDIHVIAIAWYELQRVFCNALPNGHDMLHLGCELKSLEETDEDVILTFQNGHQCRAKVVIGADGNLSRVRSSLFEDESFPEYAGSCIWRMFLRADYDKIKHGEAHIWTGDGKVLAMQKFQSSNDSDDVRVYVSAQTAWPTEKLSILDRKRYIGSEDGQDSGGRTRNQDRIERFMEAFKDFPPEVTEFAKKHCDTTSILEHPIYFRPVGRPWGKGRVTLVGDAAHMMPPNMAMGTPLAFEDSVSLAHSLRRHGLTIEALRAYEEERQPRVNRIAYRCIRDTGLYYMEKDDDANPFKMTDSMAEMFEFIMNFQQDPLPSATEESS